MKNVWSCKLSFPILPICLEIWTKQRVILVTCSVCKIILQIRLDWGITSKLLFLRKPTVHPAKRWTQTKSPKRKPWCFLSLKQWLVKRPNFATVSCLIPFSTNHSGKINKLSTRTIYPPPHQTTCLVIKSCPRKW